MDTQTGRWIPVGRADGGAEEMTVTGLEPGRKYNFRVRVSN